MSIRVIQWATGTVGIHAVPAIVAHPKLELAGLWVHSDSKAGRDAGELWVYDNRTELGIGMHDSSDAQLDLLNPLGIRLAGPAAALMVFGGYLIAGGLTVPAPEPVDEIRVYEPSTRPGAPLPHAWIDDEDGTRRPIKDLVAPGRFLLIAGEEGQAWCAAARALGREHGVPVDAVRIGHIDGDLFDPRCMWLRHRGIAADGAVLVRPDRFVAWRSAAGCDDPAAALAGALTRILARPIARPTAVPA